MKCVNCGKEVHNRDSFVFTNDERDVLCLDCAAAYVIGEQKTFKSSLNLKDINNCKYTDKHNQRCEIIKVILPPEIDPEVGVMYEVKFGDGVVLETLEEELFDI